MATAPVRVMIVDDSALYRKFVRDVLSDAEGINVVGTAHNGQAALDKLAELRPDLLTLDIEMPELDGLGVLTALRKQRSPIGAIMCSALTSRGAAVTTHALELGAFDFVVKPDQSASLEQSVGMLRGELLAKVRAFGESRRAVLARTTATAPAAAAPATNLAPPRTCLDVVAIGVSTGGPAALARLLPQLPADLPVPVLIVQHMPPLFTKSLADDLNRSCGIAVAEAVDGSRLSPGQAWVAPGGKQMKVEFGAGGLFLRINDDPPERHCKPAVDYLFRSLAENCGGKTLAIVLTGMGDDGTEGCRLLKQYRATVLAQDEATSVVFGMPRSVIEKNLADAVLPLDQIASQIVALTARRNAPCQ